MAVKIRLARIGKKHVPFFRIVAVDSRKKRDGAFLEDLGTYDALKSTLVRFDDEGVNGWVSKGAVVADSVKRLQKLHKKQQAV
jgi:small subunit ribosomal protein S16